jgi:ribosomal protein S18 acetylase RimI-like enzyme
MDIKHAIAFVDAIYWALVDARFIFDVYTWFGDYVSHAANSTHSGWLYYSAVVEISASDIGKRVTIRLHDEPGYRDIVGHLLTTTSLKNRHGEIVQFDPAQIYIWREIIDVPRTAKTGAPLSMRIYDLEKIANETWKAREEEIVGGWIFRADVGVTRRANSALILSNENHIDEVIDWYRKRDLNPTVALIPELQEELDQELERRGFKKLLDLDVMVKDGREFQVDFDYEVSSKPDSEWLAVHEDEKILPLLIKTPSKYLSIRKDGKLIAIGRTAFASDWAVISRIWVAPEFRSQGYGRKILKALESESGNRKLALQVATTNTNAIDLYKSEGYSIHHTGRFRALSQQINLSQESCC